jgi:ketosteroid isomerase-like protein
MSIELPAPIAAYVAANAQLDVDAMLAPFAPDAVVIDNGKWHEGSAQIRALFEREVLPVEATFTPDTVRHEGDRVIVEGPARGSFKGSPIRFTYDFTLAGEGIAALEITL